MAEGRWYVLYKIPEMTGDQVHRQGPYTQDEVNSHREDIRGFEGVTDVHVDVDFTEPVQEP